MTDWSNGPKDVTGVVVALTKQRDYILKAALLRLQDDQSKIEIESNAVNLGSSDLQDEFHGIELDLAPYKLKKDKRAFGIRIKTANVGSGCSVEETTLVLMLPEGKKLIPVFMGKISGSYEAIRGICQPDWNGTIQMLSTTNQDYFDLQLTKKTSSQKNKIRTRYFWDGIKYLEKK